MQERNPKSLPPQHQDHQPGDESEMIPRPDFMPRQAGSGRLKGKTALITGGDSGIGRAVSVLFAREGAQIAIVYLEEDDDAKETEALVRQEGTDCLLIKGDIGSSKFCADAVKRTLKQFNRLDVLINNAAEQHEQEDVEDISEGAAGQDLPHQSVRLHVHDASGPSPSQGRLGHRQHGFSDRLSRPQDPGRLRLDQGCGGVLHPIAVRQLAEKGIRVNAVAPGPMRTSLIPASFPADKVAKFGKDTPLGRPGQPNEVAPSHLFLACRVLHPT